MLRMTLLDKLTTVMPALADNDLIPVLTHFWFTGKELIGYNDQIGIWLPMKTDFKGAVPGSVFVNLLKNSKAKNIELEPLGENVQVKAASSKIKLGLMAESTYDTYFPREGLSNEKKVLNVDRDAFYDAITYASKSIGMDTSQADQLGITLIVEKDWLHFFSTNAATMSHSKIPFKGKAPFKDRVVLSSSFCQQFLKLAKGDDKYIIECHDSHSLLSNGKGVTLFGRLIQTDSPLDFINILDDHFPAKRSKELVPIPTKIKLILERAAIITDSSVDQTTTKITVKDGKARFVSKSARGEIIDTLQLPDHPNSSIDVEPKQLKAGYGQFDDMLVTDRCVIMKTKKAHHTYMVSAHGD